MSEQPKQAPKQEQELRGIGKPRKPGQGTPSNPPKEPQQPEPRRDK